MYYCHHILRGVTVSLLLLFNPQSSSFNFFYNQRPGPIPPQPTSIAETFYEDDPAKWVTKFREAFLIDWNNLTRWVNGVRARESRVLSGGLVTYSGSGTDYIVSPTEYVIDGLYGSFAGGTVTLAAKDATNPRIDVIAMQADSSIIVLQGAAASNPAEPTVDPMFQLKLAAVFVPSVASGLPLEDPTPVGYNLRWKRTFVLGLIQDIVAATNLTNEVPILWNSKPIAVKAQSKRPGSGTITFDVNLNGTSIWNVNQGFRISIPSGDSAVHTSIMFDTQQFNENDRLSIDCDSVGGSGWRFVTVDVMMEAVIPAGKILTI